jgi:hypothetical protein
MAETWLFIRKVPVSVSWSAAGAVTTWLGPTTAAHSFRAESKEQAVIVVIKSVS